MFTGRVEEVVVRVRSTDRVATLLPASVVLDKSNPGATREGNSRKRREGRDDH